MKSTMFVWRNPCISVVLIGILTSPAFAGNITYNVVERRLMDHDGVAYDITGSITTNGTMGNLSASDFIDYKIEVAGPRPFTFMPGTPDDGVTIRGAVTATEDRIFLLEDPNSDVLNIGALPDPDSSGSSCGFSRHASGPCIAWHAVFNPFFNDDVEAAVDYVGIGTGRVWRRETIETITFPLPEPLTFTVPFNIAVVPEPNASIQLMMATIGFFALGRKPRIWTPRNRPRR